MRKPVLAERTTPQSPPAPATWKGQLHGTSRFSVNAGRETELPSGEANESFRSASQEAPSGALHELERARTAEREKRPLDFFGSRAQQHRSLPRCPTLSAHA